MTICCDGCGDNNATAFRINMGKSMDPSGNGYNTDWDYKDFCPACLELFKKKNPELKLQETH